MRGVHAALRQSDNDEWASQNNHKQSSALSKNNHINLQPREIAQKKVKLNRSELN
jgi:hypothetical protein